MDKVAFFYNLGREAAINKIAADRSRRVGEETTKGTIGGSILGGLTGAGLGGLIGGGKGALIGLIPGVIGGSALGTLLGGAPAVISPEHPYLASMGIGGLLGAIPAGALSYGLSSLLTEGKGGGKEALISALGGGALGALTALGLRAPAMGVGSLVYRPKKTTMEKIKEKFGLD
jgi:hypothetical protein